MASKLEARVHEILRVREANGEIEDIKKQFPIILQDGKRDTKITWVVDFAYTVVATGLTEIVEAKGFETDVFRLKLKLYRARRPYALEIWKGSYRSPRLVERIEARRE